MVKKLDLLESNGSVANANSIAPSKYGNIAGTRMNSRLGQKQARVGLFCPR
jgi:hypothetical protein